MSGKDEFFDQVHQTFPDKAVEVKDELKDKYFPKPTMKPTKATFSLSYIIPTGEFQNIKTALDITFEGEEINFREGWDRVESELKQEVNKLKVAQANIEASKTLTERPTSNVSSQDELCPNDKGLLVSGETKNGKKFIKCSNNKWDRNLKKAVGCDYIKWL